jgi:hypothetical protein
VKIFVFFVFFDTHSIPLLTNCSWSAFFYWSKAIKLLLFVLNKMSSDRSQKSMSFSNESSPELVSRGSPHPRMGSPSNSPRAQINSEANISIPSGFIPVSQSAVNPIRGRSVASSSRSHFSTEDAIQTVQTVAKRCNNIALHAKQEFENSVKRMNELFAECSEAVNDANHLVDRLRHQAETQNSRGHSKDSQRELSTSLVQNLHAQHSQNLMELQAPPNSPVVIRNPASGHVNPRDAFSPVNSVFPQRRDVSEHSETHIGVPIDLLHEGRAIPPLGEQQKLEILPDGNTANAPMRTIDEHIRRTSDSKLRLLEEELRRRRKEYQRIFSAYNGDADHPIVTASKDWVTAAELAVAQWRQIKSLMDSDAKSRERRASSIVNQSQIQTDLPIQGNSHDSHVRQPSVSSPSESQGQATQTLSGLRPLQMHHQISGHNTPVSGVLSPYQKPLPDPGLSIVPKMATIDQYLPQQIVKSEPRDSTVPNIRTSNKLVSLAECSLREHADVPCEKSPFVKVGIKPELPDSYSGEADVEKFDIFVTSMINVLEAYNLMGSESGTAAARMRMFGQKLSGKAGEWFRKNISYADPALTSWDLPRLIEALQEAFLPSSIHLNASTSYSNLTQGSKSVSELKTEFDTLIDCLAIAPDIYSQCI